MFWGVRVGSRFLARDAGIQLSPGIIDLCSEDFGAMWL